MSAVSTEMRRTVRLRIGERLVRGLILAVLVLGGLVAVFPYYWMVSNSFKTDRQIFAWPPLLYPPTPTLDNITGIFSTQPFGRWILNSVIVAMFRVPLVVLFCALGGYAFAKYDFKGRGVLFGIVLGSMMIPFHILLVPLYIFIIRLGLKDTYITLILPALASGFGIFLMKQFMMSLPDEMMDAARIDGASEFGIFWRVALPLARPGLATLTLFTFLSSWNDFIWPLIVLNKKLMYTLPVGLAVLKGHDLWNTPWGHTMAAAFISSLPILLIFVLMQKQFISGLHLGSVKG